MRISAKKNSVKIASTIIICVMALVFVVLIVQFTNIITMKNRERNLMATYERTQKQIEEYDELIDYIDYNNGTYSQEFLESYAREVYGWGKADRIYYENNK